MPEDRDLLVCQSALHTVRVVSKSIVVFVHVIGLIAVVIFFSFVAEGLEKLRVEPGDCMLGEMGFLEAKDVGLVVSQRKRLTGQAA